MPLHCCQGGSLANPNSIISHVSNTLFRWQRRIPPPVSYVLIVAIYLLSWTALDFASLWFETAPEIQVWYPPSALDVVLLLVFGLRYSPALLLNTFVHEFFVSKRGIPIVTLLIFNLVTTLGYVGACVLLLRKLRINPRLRKLRDVVWFMVVAAITAPLVIALLQVLNFALSGVIPWSKSFTYMLHYWAGDSTGIAMLAPFLIILLRQLPWAWSHREDEAASEAKLGWPTRREARKLLVEIFVLGGAVWAAYGTPKGVALDYTYFIFLPLIWMAMKYGFARAATVVLLINVGIAILVGGRIGNTNALTLQFGLMALSHTGLLLGAVSTERFQAEKALRNSSEHLMYNAFHDPLTGLPNRALFMDRLEHAIEHGKRHKDYLFAVLFLDLDRFKVINDSLGHTLGDQLLITIAGRLEACLRPTDTVARIGGDEFTALLEGLEDVSDVIRVAERIQQEITLPLDLGGQQVFTTVSIGIALNAVDYNSEKGYNRAEDILRDADVAMYRAKELGKAGYQMFSTSMHTQALARLQLETDLRLAIERGEFRIHYQPIISLETGKIIGFEALVRWEHPQRGFLHPDQFIPIAEEIGLLSSIDWWVLRASCRQTQQWQKQFIDNLPLSISVNLSNKQFTQPTLLEQIKQILQETSLDAQSLKMEITENVIMENGEAVIAKLWQLKALGIELAIDDFGTGYSSLGRLHDFPINILKIDRSFVSNMDERGNLEVVRTIVTLAHHLSVDVIAEGVETAEQLAQLRELKCGYGQGYFFSRPLNSNAAEALILAKPQW